MEPIALELPDRKRMPVERIRRHADEHGIALGRQPLFDSIDRSRFFTSPVLAPLSYASIFSELSAEQQRRYNQLVGLMQNELIGFFEQEFAGGVLPAVVKRSRAMPPALVASLEQFLHEERQHTAMFRRLNRLAEPRWYRDHDHHILQLPRPFLAIVRFITRRPLVFPMVFWVMLLMEERSLLISRRYAEMDAQLLDPQFAATYRAHAEDEVRHVQLDWHLLERFYQSRPMWLRRMNAKLLEWFVVGLFLKPRRANLRLVHLLIEDFPELKPLYRRLAAAVHQLADNPGYRKMMYSPQATPIARALFARLPEFTNLRRRIFFGEPK